MRIFLAICTLSLLTASTVGAHHAVDPFFDQDVTIDISGIVKTWIFKNPHPVLVVEIPDEQNGVIEWQVHFAPATVLSKRGWTATTFQPGDEVIATGHPSRQPGTHGLEHRSIRRADGSPVVRP